MGNVFQGSNDGGATWESFATITSAAPASWSVIDLPATRTYQRLRVVDDHGGWGNVAEIELYARGVDTSLVKVLTDDVATLDASAYTAESWAAVVAARDAAQAATGTQAKVDAATASLKQAIAALEKVGPATGVPAPASLTSTNPTRSGSYVVTMQSKLGNNGTTFALYENGVLIRSQALTDASPARQRVDTAFTDRAPGTYTYVAILTNRFGSSFTSPLKVNVPKRR